MLGTAGAETNPTPSKPKVEKVTKAEFVRDPENHRLILLWVEEFFPKYPT